MAAYYIDPVGGSANAAGTSAAQPRLTHRDLNIQPGDTVLFKRGSLIRGALGNVQGTEGNPVTYGAYGAQMTGTGSAVFGIYDSFEYATVACTMLRDKYSQVYMATSV